MFLEHYNLREHPFGVTSDPRFLYLSPTHREALAALLCGIETGRGFLGLVARPGMGKTTLVVQLLERLKRTSTTAFLFQTQCDSRELLRYLLGSLGVETAGQDMVTMHEKLNEILAREMLANRKFVLVIDEAQNLDEAVLETVRLLSDFETPSAKLLQILLVGQPQLAEKLAGPSLVQLRQRLAILGQLHPFTPAETAGYIQHRLEVAGYEGDPLFTPGALEAIAAKSEGIPRNINTLCFNALALGYGLGRTKIDSAIIAEVVADLDVKTIAQNKRPVPSVAEPEVTALRPSHPRAEQPAMRPAQPLTEVQRPVSRLVPSPVPAGPEVAPMARNQATAPPVPPRRESDANLSDSSVTAVFRPSFSAKPSTAAARPSTLFARPQFYAPKKERTFGRRFLGVVAMVAALIVLFGAYSSSLGKKTDEGSVEPQPPPVMAAPSDTPAATAAADTPAAESASSPAETLASGNVNTGTAEAESASIREVRAEGFLVVVAPKQTLRQICLLHLGRYDHNLVEKILALNPALVDPNHLEIGQKILLPETPER